MRAGEIIERIRHMLKVKDCKHVCLFCEYYDMCKEEAAETSRRQSNSNKWVSKRAFLICASHIRKGFTADCLSK